MWKRVGKGEGKPNCEKGLEKKEERPTRGVENVNITTF